MPAKEIKELRQSGKLDEAYDMAKSERDADPDNIWGKRNMSWVLYSQLDANASNFLAFLQKIEEVKKLELPETEEMFFENISIVIAKAARFITNGARVEIGMMHMLFDAIKDIPFKRNSKWFSVLFISLHKGMKQGYRYIEFADWWDFKNLRPEDFQKEKLSNGKEIMSTAEQAYIAYAKHILAKLSIPAEANFGKEKALYFMPQLSELLEKHPEFQYPPYFYAKLLLAMGDETNLLECLLPFVKKKQNDFWAWEILAEANAKDPDKAFACYCKALSCKSPEEMMVGLRQKMAKLLIAKKQYKEARAEIDLLVDTRNRHSFRIPDEVAAWQTAEWYKMVPATTSNSGYYKAYIPLAESVLFGDTPEELVIVEFVNSDRKILNFIASENKFGFIKYERFFSNVKVGDTLKVRFQAGSNEGMYRVYTAVKFDDESFKNNFLRKISGNVKKLASQSFAFIEDVFIHPSLVSKYKLADGLQYTGYAIKSYNRERKHWGWKLI